VKDFKKQLLQCIADDLDVISRKIVLIRCDLNVPLSDHQLLDDTRIKAICPLVDMCQRQKATVILISHFGNPAEVDPAYSIKKIVPFLPWSVTILPELTRPSNDGKIYLLENLRFFSGEKNKDLHFAQQLARMGDVYINEAFSVCHRDHTSITVLPKLLPAYAGPHLAREIAVMKHIVNIQAHPIVFVVGGAKTATKMPYLDPILKRVDYMIVGGAFVSVFSDAKNVQAQNLLKKYRHKIILSKDVVRDDTGTILDLGPESILQNAEIIHHAKLIIWNGVLGKIEQKPYHKATEALVAATQQNSAAQLVVGGGSTAGVINPNMPQLYHVSTGGGAFLEYYAYHKLVGVKALIRRKRSTFRA
jgi:phosphoglycerate kinase